MSDTELSNPVYKMKKSEIWKILKREKPNRVSKWKTSKATMLEELNATTGYMVQVDVRFIPYKPFQNDIELLIDSITRPLTIKVKKDPRKDKETYAKIVSIIKNQVEREGFYKKAFVVDDSIDLKLDFNDRQDLYKNRNKIYKRLPLTVSKITYTPNGIKNVILKSGNPPEYPSLGLNSDIWNTHKDKCVFSALLLQLQGTIRFKNLTRARLINELPNEVAVGDVYNWLENNEVPAYIIDGTNRIIYRNEGKDKKCVYFKIENNHIYPITDIELQKEIRYNKKILNPKISWKNGHRFSNDLSLDKLTGGVVITSNDLESLVIKAITSGVMVENIGINTRGLITKLSYKNTWIIQDKYYDTIIEATNVCKGLNHIKQSNARLKKFEYKSQNLQSITNELIDILNVGQLPKSLLNKHVLDIFYSHAHGSYNKTILDQEGTHTVDIRRCYTDILYNRKHCYGIFSPFDDFQKFDGEIYEGSFYIVDKVKLPFGDNYNNGLMLGDGIYDSEFVENCLNEGLITKSQIKKQLVPFNSVPHDYFKNVIDTIYKHFSDTVAKEMINTFVGTLNPSSSVVLDPFITASKDMANNHANVKDNKYKPIGDLFLCYTHKQKPVIMNNKPMYYSVVCGSFWSLYKLGKILSPYTEKVIKYHTDSITIVADNVILPVQLPVQNEADKPYGLGTYRHVILDTPGAVNQSMFYSTYTAPVYTGDGIFIHGSAGRGKTHTLVNKILPELTTNKDYVVASTTHKALANIKTKGNFQVKTLASLFNLKSISMAIHLKNLEKKYNTIIVEEYTMTSQYHMTLVYRLFLMGVKFVFVGDEKQIPGVDIRLIRYIDRTFFKEMIGTDIHLTLNYRFDEALDLIAMKVYTEGMFKYGRVGKSLMNICYTNKKRIEINMSYMSGRKIGKYKYSVGTPVISIKNENDLCNGQLFNIQEITDNYVKVNHIEFNYKKFIYQFELAYAVTTHKLQGSDVEGIVCIHEIEKMSRQLLYTALCRLTSLSNLRVPHPVDLTGIKSEKYITGGKNYTRSLTLRKQGYIYTIEQDNETIYVGSTDDMSRRYDEHLSCIGNESPLLYTRLRPDFKMKLYKIIRYDDKDELLLAEMEAIKELSIECNLLNVVGTKQIKTKRLTIGTYKKNDTILRGCIVNLNDRVRFKWYVNGIKNVKRFGITKTRTREQAIKLAIEFQRSIYN